MPITNSILPTLNSRANTPTVEKFMQYHRSMLPKNTAKQEAPKGTVFTLMDDKSIIVIMRNAAREYVERVREGVKQVPAIIIRSNASDNQITNFSRTVEEWQENYLAHFADRYNIFEDDKNSQALVEKELEDELLESVKKQTPKEIEFDNLRELTQMVANAAKSFYQNTVIHPIENLKDFKALKNVMSEFVQNAMKMADIDSKTGELLEIAKQKRTRGAVKNYNVQAREYNKIADRQNRLQDERSELQEKIYNQMISMDLRPLAFYRTIRTASAFEPQLGELKPLRDGIAEDAKRMAELEGKNDSLSKSEYKHLKKAMLAKKARLKEIDGLNRKTIRENNVNEDVISSLYLENGKTLSRTPKKPIVILDGKEV